MIPQPITAAVTRNISIAFLLNLFKTPPPIVTNFPNFTTYPKKKQDENCNQSNDKCHYFRQDNSTLTISGKLKILTGIMLFPKPRLIIISMPPLLCFPSVYSGRNP